MIIPLRSGGYISPGFSFHVLRENPAFILFSTYLRIFILYSCGGILSIFIYRECGRRQYYFEYSLSKGLASW
jgi:hypothetical protein